MRHTIQAVVVGVLSVAALCLGYGGFEVTGTFNDAKGLNHTLDSLNQVKNGSGNFTYKSSMWWFGGHGGAHRASDSKLVFVPPRPLLCRSGSDRCHLCSDYCCP